VAVAHLCIGGAVKIALKRGLRYSIAMWGIDVEKGWNRLLLPKIGFTTTAHRMHVGGTLGRTLERA
jgi:hypothetical protein